MSCRTALISVGLSWAVGMVLLVLLLEGVGVGVVEVVEAPPFMLRSVGPAERETQGEGAADTLHDTWEVAAPLMLYWGSAVGQALGPLAPVCLDDCTSTAWNEAWH